MGRTLSFLFRASLVTALALPLILASPVDASCVAPELSVGKSRVRAGEIVRVRGEGWFSCSESEGGACSEGPEVAEPMDGISVTLTRSGGGIVQETSAEGPDWKVTIFTEGLTPDTYSIVATHGNVQVRSNPLRVLPAQL